MSSVSPFKQAVDSFKARAKLTPKEMQDLQAVSLSDLQRTMGSIQSEQKASRQGQALRRIEPFLETMERYGKVIDVFSNSSMFVAFVWGPIKFLLLATAHLPKAFNLLLEGYKDISLDLPHLEKYEHLFKENDRMQEALALMYSDILEFHLEAINYFKQKTWKKMLQAFGTKFETRITNLRRLLRANKEYISNEAQISHFEELQNVRADEQERFKVEQEKSRDSRRARVQEWLGSLNPEKAHQDACRRRFAKTGVWLFKNSKFERWFDAKHCSDQLLWLSGIPGAGKTVLTSSIIEEARSLPGVTVAFYYCRNIVGSVQDSGILDIAKCMLSQLLSSDDLVDYLYSERRHAELQDAGKACELLETALLALPKVYVVIDGLDEFSRRDRKEVSTWFIDLVKSIPKVDSDSLRCLFVSQDDGIARKDFGTLSNIKMTANHNFSDISAFCEARHKDIEEKLGPLVKEEHNVAKIVSIRAKGMFLFAHLVMSNLLAQSRRVDLEDELRPNVLPNGIDEAYHRIIKRILPDQSKGSAKHSIVLKLLAWIACAKRSLKWFEIQGAMAVDLDEVCMDPKYMFDEDCKEVCASLVEVSSDQTVTLVHQTAKTYLIENKFIDENNTNIDLAILTLAYLSFPMFHIDDDDLDIDEHLHKGDYAFYDYSVCSWGLHLESGIKGFAESERIAKLQDYLALFLECHEKSNKVLEEPNENTKKCLKPLRGSEHFKLACHAFHEYKNQLRYVSKSKPEDEIIRLSDVTLRIRKALEAQEGVSDKEKRVLISKHYGDNLFKCPRMSCQYFHRGFDVERKRKQHIEKHERSHLCPYAEEGCDKAIFGYTSARDLEEHIIEYHGFGKADSSVSEFPPDESSDALRLGRKFLCEVCHKAFPRKFNLKVHQKIHTGERKYVCPVEACRRAFTRESDCMRHERNHYDYEGLVCRGETNQGIEWGCGKRFSKVKTLVKHLRSEDGQDHIRPLVESFERLRLVPESSVTSSGEPPCKRARRTVAVVNEQGRLHDAVIERFPEIVGIKTH